MHPLERKIINKIIQDEVISDDEHVVVIGVSGGPDSIALLHLLLPLQIEGRLSIVAVYVNHGLRPEEAPLEEKLVRSMCADLNVGFENVAVDVREYSRQEKKSLEHAARDLRYEALQEIRKKYNGSVIAVAHTADDQVEEILIRLLRGSGRKGLSGMPVRVGHIIRPLLSEKKDTLLDYLEEKNIEFCQDSSNTDMRFLRNRVRHQLIPFLEKNFDKGIRNALPKTAETLAEDELFLDDLAEESLNKVLMVPDEEEGHGNLARLMLDRQEFVLLPSAIQRRVVEKMLWKAGCRAKYSHIVKIVEAALHGTTGSEIHLNRGLRVGVQRRFLEFVYPEGKTSWRGRLYK